MKKPLLLLILGAVMGAIVMIGGCGETTYEGSSYYYPNWMPDGRIICYKVTSRWSNTFWGRKELGDTDYVAAITINASDEITKEENLFEVAGGPEEITCSPTGEMIGWVLSGHGAENIKISDYKGTVLHTIIAPSGEAMQYFDWSPDAAKIAYSAGNKLCVINVDGTGNTQIAASAEAIAWRVGEKIVYIDTVYIEGWGQYPNKATTINSDGLNKIELVEGRDPQVSNDNKIFYRGASAESSTKINSVRKVNIDGTDDGYLFNYERSTLKLSFDNTRIVGGDLITGGGSRIGGIWVMDLNDGKSTQIR